MNFKDLFLPPRTSSPAKSEFIKKTPLNFESAQLRPPKIKDGAESRYWQVKYLLDTGLALSTKDNPEELKTAEQVFVQALLLDQEQNFPKLWLHLAMVREKQGDLDSLLTAKEAYRRYLQLVAYDAPALCQFAILKTKLGLQEQQQPDFEHIQTLLRQALTSRAQHHGSLEETERLLQTTSAALLPLVEQYAAALPLPENVLNQTNERSEIIERYQTLITLLYFLATFANLKPTWSAFREIKMLEIMTRPVVPPLSEKEQQESPAYQFVFLGAKLCQQALLLVAEPFSLDMSLFQFKAHFQFSNYYQSFLRLLEKLLGTSYELPDRALAAYRQGHFYATIITFLYIILLTGGLALILLSSPAWFIVIGGLSSWLFLVLSLLETLVGYKKLHLG